MSKKRILCVDDNPDDCELIRTYLGLADYEVTAASTVAEGLRLAQEGHFDLYLIDLQLADGSGIDLAHQIQAFDQKTPLVFHSASAYAADIQQGLDTGAQAYLTKPSDPDEVVETITKLIAGEAVESTDSAVNGSRKNNSYSSSRAVRWPRP